MKRALPLIVVLLGALGVALWFFANEREDQDATPENVLAIEQAIASGDFAGARSQLATARSGLPPGYAEYLDGLLLFVDGRLVEATNAFEAAHAKGPPDPRLTDALLNALFQLGRFDDAKAVVDRYTEAHQEEPRALWFRAQIETHPANPARSPARGIEYLTRIERARKRLVDAGANDPDDGIRPASLLDMQARCLSETGRHQSAVEVARELVAETQTDQHGWVTLGDVARIASREGLREYTDVAVEAYRRAAQLPPPNRHVMLLLTDALLQTPGRQGEAVELTGQLVAANPTDRDFRVLRARACVRTDEERLMDEAHDIYRALLAENPKDLEVLRNLAVLLYDWKQGGQEGEYLRESYLLLRRYVQGGGKVDGQLREVMRILSQKARAAGVPLEEPPPSVPKSPDEASTDPPKDPPGDR